jgi:hypothetical protein
VVVATSGLYFGLPKKDKSPGRAVCSEAIPFRVSVVVPRLAVAWTISMISADERENSMVRSVHGLAALAMSQRLEDKKSPARWSGALKVFP